MQHQLSNMLIQIQVWRMMPRSSRNNDRVYVNSLLRKRQVADATLYKSTMKHGPSVRKGLEFCKTETTFYSCTFGPPSRMTASCHWCCFPYSPANAPLASTGRPTLNTSSAE